MQNSLTINDSYYCMRSKPDGRVSILTTNSYVVGEYDVNTGDIRWQRVVLANQKIAIQNFLARHFPVKVEPVVMKAPVPVPAPVKEIRKKVAKVGKVAKVAAAGAY
jgi:hypothetical protein